MEDTSVCFELARLGSIPNAEGFVAGCTAGSAAAGTG